MAWLPSNMNEHPTDLIVDQIHGSQSSRGDRNTKSRSPISGTTSNHANGPSITERMQRLVADAGNTKKKARGDATSEQIC